MPRSVLRLVVQQRNASHESLSSSTRFHRNPSPLPALSAREVQRPTGTNVSLA